MSIDSIQKLVDQFDTLANLGFIKYEPRDYITENLSPRIKLRPYQEVALARLEYYFESYKLRKEPAHLLFNMATGSGKTVVMAANILYLYKAGYRNFIFFVNSTNVIEKTRANFLDSVSHKYLFANKVIIDGKIVNIQEVDTFSNSDINGINIIFTTIQGLHININTPHENNITLAELRDKKIVLLSDEAHHLDALTKSPSSLSTEEKNQKTWEGTVDRIFTGNTENIMLAYTATVKLDHPKIVEKYHDKIIYKYDLRKFCEEKYSKQIRLIQSDTNQRMRIIHALILSQYRRKVAQDNGLSLKPCILFKSPKIDESKKACEDFDTLIKNLTVQDIEEAKNMGKNGTVGKAFAYFEEKGTPLYDIVRQLKDEFRHERIIELNTRTKKDTIDNKNVQLLVNNLEADDTKRVIFVVDMLNEGWDVLNLFDIVRLDEGTGTDKTTIRDAQLIGRGARYWPFRLNEESEFEKRKFDTTPDTHLCCLEELYYHSVNNSQYISDLEKTLKEMGIYSKSTKTSRELKVKESIKKTVFWEEGLLFKNDQQKRDRKKIFSLAGLSQKGSVDTIRILSDSIFEKMLFSDTNAIQTEKITKQLSIEDIGYSAMRKAMDKDIFFTFDKLNFYFPNLESISQFITSLDYCGGLNILVTGIKQQVDNLSSREKLRSACIIMGKVKKYIQDNSQEKTGSKEFAANRVKDIVKDVVLHYTINNGEAETGKSMKDHLTPEYRADLESAAWYVQNDNFGTSEEKALIKFIESQIDKFKEIYDEVYLLRNEGFVALYDFDEGRRFEPDFLLFLKDTKTSKVINYQLFIEPKGDFLISNDQWKEDFLKRIQGEGIFSQDLFTIGTDFRLVGLPFFNDSKRSDFNKALYNTLFSKQGE